jgi:hypothetical protein
MGYGMIWDDMGFFDVWRYEDIIDPETWILINFHCKSRGATFQNIRTTGKTKKLGFRLSDFRAESKLYVEKSKKGANILGKQGAVKLDV